MPDLCLPVMDNASTTKTITIIRRASLALNPSVARHAHFGNVAQPVQGRERQHHNPGCRRGPHQTFVVNVSRRFLIQPDNATFRNICSPECGRFENTLQTIKIVGTDQTIYSQFVRTHAGTR